jgi:hypothetical protein
MIIYGYVIDLDKLSSKDKDKFYGSGLAETCYTTGCAIITIAMFGIRLSNESCLFNPIAVSDLKLFPTEEQVKQLQREWAALPKSIRDKAENKEPAAYLFDTTDD